MLREGAVVTGSTCATNISLAIAHGTRNQHALIKKREERLLIMLVQTSEDHRAECEMYTKEMMGAKGQEGCRRRSGSAH